MIKFYEAVVKYDRMGEEGTPKKVTEQYLLDAVSIGETEKLLIAELEGMGEIDITSIKLSKYCEFIPYNILTGAVVTGENQITIDSDETEDDHKYFDVKLSFITLDEMKGKEKKTAFRYITKASSVEAAGKTVKLFMAGSLADWEINNIIETKIVDVLLYNREPVV